MSRFAGPKFWLLATLAVAFGISYFAPQFNRYYLGISIDIGIAIIMAASLNLINGYTGQFSLGHAGFMAVGGYTAGKLSLVIAAGSGATWCLPISLVAGGLMAAVAGLLVGIPLLVPKVGLLKALGWWLERTGEVLRLLAGVLR